jgi:uncharacterized protein
MSATEVTNIQVRELESARIRVRPLCSTAIYALTVALGGALLAPWLYRLAQYVAPGSHLANNPFRRFMDRSLWGMAAIGLWPYLRSVDIKSWRDIGVVNPSGQWRRLAGGFLLGVGSLAATLAVVLMAHARQISTHVLGGEVSAAQFAGRIVTALATGVAVGCLEEILFRGVVFSGIRRGWDWRIALLISSGIFAFVHFLKIPDPATVTWSSGLEALPNMARSLAGWEQAVPGFFNVMLIGILLGLAYRATGNLYLSIGLHAGWIFSLKLYGFLTVRVPGSHFRIWGTEKFTDGWLGLAVLMLTLLVLQRLPMARPRRHTT